MKMTSFARSLLLGLFAVLGTTLADAVPAAAAGAAARATAPADLGFSAARLAAIDRFYEQQVQRGEMAGIVLLIARHGRIVHHTAIGYSDLVSRQPLRTDALYRWYSMTKPITSTALMQLYEQGKFQLKDPVAKYLPEFTNVKVLRKPDGPLTDTVPAEHALTIQDVMRHTAGYSHGLGSDNYEKSYAQAGVFGLDVTLADMMGKLAALPMRHQPGTVWDYSIGPDIQARLVEVLSGMPFDEYLQRNLFQPLKMKDAGFFASPAAAARLVPVSWMNQEHHLVPLDAEHGHPDGGFLLQPEFVNSYTVNHRRKGGSYGLIGTAEDYFRFAQAMLNGGTLDGARILAPRTVDFMTRDHLGEIRMPTQDGTQSGMGFGLGFAVIKDPALAGEMTSTGTYTWAGAAATHFWVDPKEDLVVVALTQLMDAPAAQPLWPQLRALVYSSLSK
jgi:CubicO group peptidase (beta-lactamase class C family)